MLFIIIVSMPTSWPDVFVTFGYRLFEPTRNRELEFDKEIGQVFSRRFMNTKFTISIGISCELFLY